MHPYKDILSKYTLWKTTASNIALREFLEHMQQHKEQVMNGRGEGILSNSCTPTAGEHCRGIGKTQRRSVCQALDLVTIALIDRE